MARIEMNCLEQWVMSVTGRCRHPSSKVLPLRGRNYNNDPKAYIKMMSAVVDYCGRHSQ